jgi:uncharacterized protein (DUF934 family)
MRYILRQREWVPDEWRYLGEEHAAAGALIVPWTQLRADPARFAGQARLGVRLEPPDAVEELEPLVGRLQLIAVEFPNAGDGRGYSQGQLLRERLHFSGELRAVGAGVRQDQVFFLARSGFDALELATGEDPQAALRAYGRYDVAYQPGAAQLALCRQRFFA